jgi:hypothetical protein
MKANRPKHPGLELARACRAHCVAYRRPCIGKKGTGGNFITGGSACQRTRTTHVRAAINVERASGVCKQPPATPAPRSRRRAAVRLPRAAERGRRAVRAVGGRAAAGVWR